MNHITELGSVLLPLLASAFCFVYLILHLSRNMAKLPLADVGLIFSTFVFLYTVMPLLGAVLAEGNASDFTDNRLRAYDPSPSEVGEFMWNYVAFLAGFVAVYSQVRRQEIIINIDTENIRQFQTGTLVLVVFLSIYFLVLNALSGVAIGTTYDESFFENFERHSNLPLIVQQVSSRLTGILLIAKIALVAIIVANRRYPLWRLFGAIWLIFEIARPFVELGARSGSFFILITFISCFHYMVRPIALRSILIGAIVLFTGYLTQGILRSGSDYGQFGLFEATLAGNEFQSMFATAFDIKNQMENAAVHVPWQVYFSDFLRVLPQQLVPFIKLDSAEWYLDLVGAKGLGLGFGFGAISEGLIGFGLPDLLIRGALLGGVVGLIHNATCKNAGSFVWIIFYLWFCTRIYLSFRNSIFFWLSSILYEFVPAMLVLFVMRNKNLRNISIDKHG
jgi:hypothetical protein